jgi:hypothetical protein
MFSVTMSERRRSGVTSVMGDLLGVPPGGGKSGAEEYGDRR